MTIKRKYLCKPDTYDHRDHLFGAVHPSPVTHLPPSVSLRDKMPPAFDQGELGSCTANAAAGAYAFVHGGGPYSRLQIYYDERVIEGTVDQDSGAELRDAVKVLATVGAGFEKDWPYDITKFKEAPPKVELAEAAQNKAVSYSRLTGRNDFRKCLAAGFPFIIGIMVYESFESETVTKTGVVPMPSNAEQCMGGHAVCVIGYNTSIHGGDYYEVRNSWGADWGDQGNFWLPAAYLEHVKLATDAWTIRK